MLMQVLNANYTLFLQASSSSVDGAVTLQSEGEALYEQPELHGADTFRAFTETVEALALQKSVIGLSINLIH
jgi:hypothetical protein